MDTNVPTPGGTSNEVELESQPTFTCFPKLPIELRFKIWKEAKEPRIIEVRFHNDCRKNKHHFLAKQPVVLQVCRESRNEALKSYKKAFTNKWAHNNVYFDFTTDILFISYPLKQSHLKFFLERQKTADLGSVQRLALPDRDFLTQGDFMSKFTALNELSAVTHYGYWGHEQISSCASHGIGFHDLGELSRPTDELSLAVNNYRRFFSEFQKGFEERFPEVTVPIINKFLCENDVIHSRYL